MSISKNINRNGRVINPGPVQRGKRHYWGHHKVDYGFYKSHDLDDLLSYSRSKTINQNVKEYNSLKKINYEQPQQNEKQASRKNSLNSKKQSRKNKRQDKNKNNKSILRIQNSYQLQLPSLGARTGKLKQQTVPLRNNHYEDVQIQRNHSYEQDNYNSAGYYGPSYERQQNMRNEGQYNQQEQQFPRRIKSQMAQYYYDHITNRPHRVRYTPTYICSLSNPLPSLKIFSTQRANALKVRR